MLTARSLRGASALSVVAVLVVVAAGCDASPGDSPIATGARAPFVDTTSDSGISFVHFNGMSGEEYIVEMMGPGGALFDFDGDGDLDLWLRQGSVLGPDKTLADTSFPPDGGVAPSDRLYRNDIDGSQRLVFTDVTSETGLEVADYGIGIATGDYDADGDVDLYLTNFGPNRLLRNEGDGAFRDVTSASGTDDSRWSVPAVFVDVDRDGWLDLYVGNYIDFNLKNHKQCFRPNSAEDYCGPLSYRPEPDRLFRNRGDGTFEDDTAAAGLAVSYGNALGVLAQDFDRDGWIDLFVANDAQENHLWINRGNGTFAEEGLIRGVALNNRGEREGSMGVSAGDFNGDGAPDIFITHMATETNTLYANDGAALFRDATLTAGLVASSRQMTGFGTSWTDFDNDGYLDLLVANGEVKVIEALEVAGDPYPLHQKNQLFRNLGNGRFEELSADAGPAFELSEVSRGAIFGDVDNDGDTDAVIVNNNGPARLLLNAVGQDAHWLGLVLRDRQGRTAQGARVELSRPGRQPLVRWSGTDGSYCSANDPRVLFGLGSDGAATRVVRIDWPGGTSERFSIDVTDTYVELVEGDGTPAG